jgi:hypothetical protein
VAQVSSHHATSAIMAHFDGRSRDGVQTTEIELAAKILDCDGREVLVSVLLYP